MDYGWDIREKRNQGRCLDLWTNELGEGCTRLLYGKVSGKRGFWKELKSSILERFGFRSL